MERETLLTCPECGFEAPVTMPVDRCVVQRACTECQKVLRPRKGDCCVFCSYGSVPCPPEQALA